jgi:two-component system chemotaxis response regulator CheY
MPSPVLLRVLVVDDQESMRWIVQNHLKQLNITRVVQAASKDQALEKLAETKFDLVLSDFNMDNGTGLDLLKAVRSSPLLRKMPFIMLTGNADASVVQAVAKAGVNNYLVKPISLDSLRKRIEQVLGPLK